MSVTDFISNIMAALTDWGIDYTETSDGIGVGLASIRVAEDGDGVMATILDGANLVGMTGQAAKAAALLAFPLARKAWDAGYTGVFEVDVLGDEVDLHLNCGSDYVTLSSKVGSDDAFIITRHPLFSEHMQIDDLQAVLESAQLSYQNPEEAWQALCLAGDFERDDWMALVEHFQWTARFDHGPRFTKVETSESDNVALVEDFDPGSPIRVINVALAYDTTCCAQSDIAAAVLYAIS